MKRRKLLKVTLPQSSSPQDAIATTENGAEAEKRDRERLTELLEAANAKKPKPGAAAEMRRFLDERPHLSEKPTLIMTIVEQGLIEKVIGDRPGTIELIRAELKGIRDRLGYEDSPQLERLIIGEICMSWLWLQWLDAQLTKGGETIALIEYWQRRVMLAHKRFVRASESLARVRKLTERKPSAFTTAYLREMAKYQARS